MLPFQNKNTDLDILSPAIGERLYLPLIETTINAGFPSPALDFTDKTIDLNEEYIKNPSTTFLGRVKGLSMINKHIVPGDLLIIDKSLKPGNGDVAVCFIDGEFTMKELKIEKDCCWLLPANEAFQPIKVTEDNDFVVWGIVTAVIHTIKNVRSRRLQ
jgi:DNA polymerase V